MPWQRPRHFQENLFPKYQIQGIAIKYYTTWSEAVPFYIFRGTDAPGMAAIRLKIRDSHRSYIRIATPNCRVVAGGPLVNDAGDTMFGTLLVFEATDRDAVLQFLAGDPYAKANLFARSEVDRWQWGLGDLVLPPKD